MRFRGIIQFLRTCSQLSSALSLLVLIGAVAACKDKSDSGGRMVSRTFASMGTELKLTAWTTDDDGAEAAFGAVFGEMQRLEALLSNWRQDSEIQQLNVGAGKHAVSIGKDLHDVLRTAEQISEWTGGKFDVTFGALAGLWKFDYQDRDGTIPDRNDVLRRMKLINYRDLIIDEQSGTAFLQRQGMVAHLGGIGKGYAVDRAKDMLHQRGFHNFMIQFGGDLYVAGRAGNRPWRLGIQDPRGPSNKIFAAVDLSDSTFSTSGDYERYFIRDGRRYHHIIDPATGEPAMKSRSVTIMAGSATIADGLSTGVFIMGPEAGMALIEQLPDVEGVIVGADNKVLVSSGLKGRLTLLGQPTDAP
jgi:FAD:protein FMN transferase